MKKIFTFLIIIPHLLSGQSVQDFLTFQASAGLNYTKLVYKDANFERMVQPFLGVNTQLLPNSNFGIKASVHYSIWSSQSLSPHYWHRNNYAEFKFMPCYRIPEFLSLNLGIAASMLTKSRILTLDGSTGSGKKSEPLSGYNSIYHPVAGFDLQLSDRLILGVNYFIPLDKQSGKNFQVGLQIPLGAASQTKTPARAMTCKRAKEQIHDLKHGILLVRLPVYENTIHALRGAGHHDKADKTEKARDIENQKIMAAFVNHFDFCEVFFFNNTHISQVKNSEYDGILFNSGHEIIDPEKYGFSHKQVFISAFMILPGDTTKRFSDYELRVNPDGSGWEKRVYYHTEPAFGFDALVITDQQLYPLRKPFPYYVRLLGKSLSTHPEQAPFLAPILPFQQYSYNTAVSRLNRQLSRFFEKNR